MNEMPQLWWNPETKIATKKCTYKSCAVKIFTVVADSEEDAQEKFLAYFHKSASGYRSNADRLQSGCIDCRNHFIGKRIPNGKTKAQMFAEQGGKCLLCNKKCTDVDHAHESPWAGLSGGHIRGLLCARCNNRMQGVDNDPWLLKAIAYRDAFRAKFGRRLKIVRQ
jgi:Recombination endonuclease VII